MAGEPAVKLPWLGLRAALGYTPTFHSSETNHSGQIYSPVRGNN